MNLKLKTDGSDEAKFISLACLEAVKAMPWPSLGPDDRAPEAYISISEPTKPGQVEDIWFCASPAIPAQTIEDRLHIHDGANWVKKTAEFVPDLSV
jgi:hypothetical protein